MVVNFARARTGSVYSSCSGGCTVKCSEEGGETEALKQLRFFCSKTCYLVFEQGLF